MTAPLWLFIAICIPLAVLAWEAARVGSSHLQADREQRNDANRAAKRAALRKALGIEARDKALVEMLADSPYDLLPTAPCSVDCLMCELEFFDREDHRP
jgi:hypothetical protein